MATVAGMAVASALVWRTSEAAFTATTDNGGNSFAAGTVSLSDDDSGSALFTMTGLAPGSSQTACIEVTYTGSLTPASAITFYAASTNANDGSGNGLADDLDVTVELGTDGSTCAAFSAASSLYTATALASLAAVGSPLSTGWTPAGGSNGMRPFRFTITLGADTANDAQGDSSTATFTWAATS